jgi:hypothetical protein
LADLLVVSHLIGTSARNEANRFVRLCAYTPILLILNDILPQCGNAAGAIRRGQIPK